MENKHGGTMEFSTRADNLAYLVAQRVPSNEVNELGGSNVVEDDEKEAPKNQAAVPKKKDPPKVNIMEAHRTNGHASETILRRTMKKRGIVLTGAWKTCEGCARAKATQKRTNKTSTKKATAVGERLCLDTSGPFNETSVGSRYWVKIVDQFSGKSWEAYASKKSKVPGIADALITKLKSHGYNIKFLRCDNAGEHKRELVKVVDKHGVTLE